MNKSQTVVILILILVMLMGCDNTDGKYMLPGEIANQQLEVIMDGIMSKDIEMIEEVFCPYVKENNPDLEEDIMALFEFIDGDIISYSDPVGRKTSGETDEKGDVRQRITSEIEIIRTSTGKTYSIGHGAYSAHRENPDYVGVTDITIFDEDMYEPNVGYPDEAKFSIWLPEMFN